MHILIVGKSNLKLQVFGLYLPFVRTLIIKVSLSEEPEKPALWQEDNIEINFLFWNSLPNSVFHSVHFQVIYLKICTQTFRCVASGSAKREALVIGDVTLQFDDSIVIEILKSHDRCVSWQTIKWSLLSTIFKIVSSTVRINSFIFLKRELQILSQNVARDGNLLMRSWFSWAKTLRWIEIAKYFLFSIKVNIDISNINIFEGKNRYLNRYRNFVPYLS